MPWTVNPNKFGSFENTTGIEQAEQVGKANKFYHGDQYSVYHCDTISKQDGNKTILQNGWSNTVTEGFVFSTTLGTSISSVAGSSMSTVFGADIKNVLGFSWSATQALGYKFTGGIDIECKRSDSIKVVSGRKIELGKQDEWFLSPAVKKLCEDTSFTCQILKILTGSQNVVAEEVTHAAASVGTNASAVSTDAVSVDVDAVNISQRSSITSEDSDFHTVRSSSFDVQSSVINLG